MKVTRIGVFETNSSSSHSITLGTGEINDTLPVIDGLCEIHPGEYGWEEVTYHDAATKASYCLTFLKELAGANEHEYGGKKYFGEFETLTPSDVPRLEAMFINVVKNRTHAKEVRFISQNDYHEWGYIDHQSHAVCEEAFEGEEDLMNFIFNSNSCLQTDNDNH